jgi:hypothetical protein
MQIFVKDRLLLLPLSACQLFIKGKVRFVGQLVCLVDFLFPCLPCLLLDQLVESFLLRKSLRVILNFLSSRCSKKVYGTSASRRCPTFNLPV